MDKGKTFSYFTHVYETHHQPNSNFLPYKFVAKLDEDTYAHIPNLKNQLLKGLSES
eukprot:Pgem_evm1s15868